MDIKEKILERYPNTKVNDTIIIEQENLLNDFTIEEIVEICNLNQEDSWYLIFNLYSKNQNNIIDDIIKYIAKNNIEYFKNKSIEPEIEFNNPLYEESNLLKEYEKMYNSNNYTKEKLLQEHNKNIILIKEKNSKISSLSFFNEIIITKKLYKEHKLSKEEIEAFDNLYIEILKNIMIKKLENYDRTYNEYISEIVANIRNDNISLEQLKTCLETESDPLKSLLIAQKFNCQNVRYQDIPIEVIKSLKGKKIKNIYKIFSQKNYPYLSTKYTSNEINEVIIRMSTLLGEENVDNIIRHLPNDEIKILNLFNTFQKIDLSYVKTTSNKEIIYKQEFINYFMGNNLNEPNSLLNIIYNNKNELKNKIENIYYYWEELDRRFKNQFLKTRTAFLEAHFSQERIALPPDEYLLNGDIIENYYYNTEYLTTNSDNAIRELEKIYKEIKHNYQKTIPYIKGTYTVKIQDKILKYSYETLKANDPEIFKLGSATDCCFKIKGTADLFLKFCAQNIDGRVAVIKDNNNQVAAMIPMIRNGNVILCNSIESYYIKDINFMKKMFEILEKIGEEIINISTDKEDKTAISAILISNYKNKIEKLKKYKRIINFDEFSEKLTPTNYYNNLGQGGFFNIYSTEGFNKSQINLYNEQNKNKKLYEDPRMPTLELEMDYVKFELNQKLQKIVNSIYYESNQKVLDLQPAEKLIINNDWFIMIDKNHQITSQIVGNDSRAKEEYDEYLQLEQEYCSHFDKHGKIKEEAKYKV